MCEDKKRLCPDTNVETLGEVRLKKNKLSIPLINSARKATLKRYTGAKKDKLLPDQPVDYEFEIYVISLCCGMLKEYYLSRFKTSVKDDKKMLEDKSISGRKRFAIIHRLEAKEIIISNMRLFELLMQILSKSATTDDLKKVYLQKIDMLEDDKEYMRNRRAIRKYLRSFCYFANKKA